MKIKKAFNSGTLSLTRQRRVMNGWVMNFCSSLFCMRLRLAGNKNYVPVGVYQCSKTHHCNWQIHTRFKYAQQSAIKEKRCHFFSRPTAATLKAIDIFHFLNEVHQGISKQQEYFHNLIYKHNPQLLPSQVILCGSHWYNTGFSEGRTHKSKWCRII